MTRLASALIDQTNELLKNCTVSAGYCCCGASESPSGHCDNHSYTDQGEYVAAGLQRDLQTWLDAQEHRSLWRRLRDAWEAFQ